MIRLSAGRASMSEEGQAMCFMAGANSIFAGDKLLTTPNPDEDADAQLFKKLDLKPRVAYKNSVDAEDFDLTDEQLAHIQNCEHRAEHQA